MLIKRTLLFLPLFFLPIMPAACRENAVSGGLPTTEPVAAGCEDFHVLVAKTYDFKPTKLSNSEQSAKSAEMDKVWEAAKADKVRLIPCLKDELRNPDANHFFLFDGASLLITLDTSDESKKILIDAFARTELEDVVLQNWIAPLLRYALDGFDVSPAGDAWLRAKNPKYYLPQHGSLAVDKEIGALAIFGSMDEKFATPALTRIANMADHPGRDIAIKILARLGTDDANAALGKLDTTLLSQPTARLVRKSLALESAVKPREGAPKVTREQYIQAFRKLDGGDSSEFMRLATTVDDGEKDAVVVLRAEDIPAVRRARRFFASTGTPHLEEWYQSFTDILFALMKKTKS